MLVVNVESQEKRSIVFATSLLSSGSLAQANRLQHSVLSVYFCGIQVRENSQKLEQGWKRRARLGLTLHQTDFEEKNPTVLQSPWVPGHRLGPVQTPNFSLAELIHWIKYMKSLASESIRDSCFNLGRLRRSFLLARPGIPPLERLWFRRRTFHVLNPMHKLL